MHRLRNICGTFGCCKHARRGIVHPFAVSEEDATEASSRCCPLYGIFMKVDKNCESDKYPSAFLRGNIHDLDDAGEQFREKRTFALLLCNCLIVLLFVPSMVWLQNTSERIECDLDKQVRLINETVARVNITSRTIMNALCPDKPTPGGYQRDFCDECYNISNRMSPLIVDKFNFFIVTNQSRSSSSNNCSDALLGFLTLVMGVVSETECTYDLNQIFSTTQIENTSFRPFSDGQMTFDLDLREVVMVTIMHLCMGIHFKYEQISQWGDVEASQARKKWSDGMCIAMIVLNIVAFYGVLCFKGYSFKALKGVVLRYANQVKIQAQLITREKQKSEDLLHQMLPKSIANQLKSGLDIEAEHFEEVSILFSNVIGFNDVAMVAEPLQIVEFLNTTYGMIDECVERFQVYKVETVADSYLVIGGAPERCGSIHSREVASLSLCMMELTSSLSLPVSTEPLPLRIGLNSGPVVAGVIGLKNPRYCLFGDTVNTASRMQSTGEAYRIHCSESFKSAAEHHGYEFDERGTITVKGKGKMTTFWLVRRF